MEGPWVFVVGSDVFLNCVLQISDTLKHAAANAIMGDSGEESLNLIEPTAVGRSEMEFPPGVFGQPIFNRLSRVRGVIVQNDVHVQIRWDFSLDLSQKVQEFLGTVLGFGGAKDLACGHIQSGN